MSEPSGTVDERRGDLGPADVERQHVVGHDRTVGRSAVPMPVIRLRTSPDGES